MSHRALMVFVPATLALMSAGLACSASPCTETLTCTLSASTEPVVDAATGGVTADASVGEKFCDSLQMAFLHCADFAADIAAPIRPVAVHGTIDVTTELFRSSPRAARASLGPQGPDRKAGYVIDLSSGPIRDHARLTYSVYLAAIPTRGELLLGGPTFIDSDASHSFNVALGPSGATFVERRKTAGFPSVETRTSPTPLSIAFPTGVWKRLSIDVSFAPAFVRVTLNDVIVAGQGVTYGVPGKLVPFVGIEAATDDANKGTVFVDDIVLEE